MSLDVRNFNLTHLVTVVIDFFVYDYTGYLSILKHQRTDISARSVSHFEHQSKHLQAEAAFWSSTEGQTWLQMLAKVSRQGNISL